MISIALPPLRYCRIAGLSAVCEAYVHDQKLLKLYTLLISYWPKRLGISNYKGKRGTGINIRKTFAAIYVLLATPDRLNISFTDDKFKLSIVLLSWRRFRDYS